MPQRAVWKGAISFGMVVIPVKLYPATEHRDIRFVNLHKDTHTRIRMKRWSPHHDAEVTLDDLVKGYEYTKDQYVILEEADFDDLPVPSKHSLDILKFVDIKTIDPIFFERTYVLEPEELGRKPYALLRRVMEETGRIAVGKLSLRQKEHLVTVRPYENGLAVATMFYADEIRPTGEIFDDEETDVSDAELQMASMLVDQLTGEFDPEVARGRVPRRAHAGHREQARPGRPRRRRPRSAQDHGRRPHGSPQGLTRRQRLRAYPCPRRQAPLQGPQGRLAASEPPRRLALDAHREPFRPPQLGLRRLR